MAHVSLALLSMTITHWNSKRTVNHLQSEENKKHGAGPASPGGRPGLPRAVWEPSPLTAEANWLRPSRETGAPPPPFPGPEGTLALGTCVPHDA